MARFTDEELYAKYSDRLVRFASTIVGPADAEDIVIDGVVGAFGSRGWRTVEDRPSYLYRSVLNAGRMHLRAAGRRRARELRTWKPEVPSEVVPDGSFVAPEVHEAVALLSARQRAVVFLTYWEDLDERSTAKRLGISVGAVRRHLHRARTKLEEQLNV